MKKGFDQRQKLVIVKKAGEIGIKEAAKVAGVHYTTVYEWRRELEALVLITSLNCQDFEVIF